MALLVDGKPFRLDDLAIKEFARNYTFIVPKTAVRRRPDNGVIEVSSGFGIPTEYRMIEKNSGRELTVRYYESSYYDDGIKREVYSPSNIMINETGKLMIPSVQAELNWFLNNHPGLEDGVQRKSYPRYPILFRLLNKPKDADRQIELFRIRREMYEYIDVDSKKAWKFDQLIAACEVLVNDKDFASVPSGFQLPTDIYSYKDMLRDNDESSREGHEKVLRAALLQVIEMYPQYAKDRLINSVDRRIVQLINLADQFELTGVKFDQKSRKWVETEDDKLVPFLAVPENKDPKKHLLAECKKDHRLLDKVEKYANLAGVFV
jgi:hypothetical protein